MSADPAPTAMLSLRRPPKQNPAPLRGFAGRRIGTAGGSGDRGSRRNAPSKHSSARAVQIQRALPRP